MEENIPRDIIGVIISYYPYTWLGVNKYFRSVSLQILSLTDKHEILALCVENGYVDLLNKILVIIAIYS